MTDVGEGHHEESGPEDSLAKAAAAGPPIEWDDDDQSPDAPSRTG